MATKIQDDDRIENAEEQDEAEEQEEEEAEDEAEEQAEEAEEDEAPKAKSKKAPTKSKKEAPAKKAGGGIVAGLREAYIAAYLKNPDGVSTEKVLAALEKKGIVPSKGTIHVQLATVKATLKSLHDRGVLKVE